MRNIRQHVNPLGLYYQQPRAQPARAPERLSGAPVEVELGCADAKFSFDFARARPDCFVVGLEIREAWVERNQQRAAREELDNLHFGYVNMNVDLDRVFAPKSVDRFHILFPDPWFKARHQKRRVVELPLLETLTRQLKAGGEIHYASDIFELTMHAMAEFEDPSARALGLHNIVEPWSFARENPVPHTSRREDTTHERGQRVWRVRYRKSAEV